jgi:hypothetical protein
MSRNKNATYDHYVSFVRAHRTYFGSYLRSLLNIGSLSTREKPLSPHSSFAFPGKPFLWMHPQAARVSVATPFTGS